MREKINQCLTYVPHLNYRFLGPPEYYSSRALDGFGSLGPLARSAIPALERELPNPERGRIAARALIAIGSASTPALQRALRHADEKVVLISLDAIEEIGTERAGGVVLDLLTALSNPSSKVRDRAAGMIGAYGARAQAAVATLVRLLEDTNCVDGAAFGLAQIGGDGVVSLLTATTNSDRRTKAATYAALIWRAEAPENYLRERYRQIGSRNVFNNALDLTAQMVTEPDYYLAHDAFNPCLNDTNAAVRAEAARRLQALGLTVTNANSP